MYYEKYIKYKLKYIKQCGSGDNESKIISPISSITCNGKEDYLCDNNTLNLGLCVKKQEDCNELDIIGSLPNIELYEPEKTEYKNSIVTGNKKGYIETFLLNSCFNPNDVMTITYKEYDQLPLNFSIITLNIMGIIRGDNDKKEFMKLRIALLIKELNKYNYPDILCFQEMSKDVFDELYPKISDKYKYYNEIVISPSSYINEKYPIEPMIISKYKPKKMTHVFLEGNLGYNDSMGIYEFDNLIIYNLYLQAGSINSPGQKYKWQHYSRCRIKQLKYINSLIDNNDKSSIILGDFNFDLNDDGQKFPEVKILNSFSFLDSYKNTNPSDIGLTENTDINTLRWNDKFEKKNYRYDAILYKNLIANSSNLFANSSEIINDYAHNRLYEKLFVGNKIDDKRLKFHIIKCKKCYDLFISDHFGVLSNFSFI